MSQHFAWLAHIIHPLGKVRLAKNGHLLSGRDYHKVDRFIVVAPTEQRAKELLREHVAPDMVSPKAQWEIRACAYGVTTIHPLLFDVGIPATDAEKQETQRQADEIRAARKAKKKR